MDQFNYAVALLSIITGLGLSDYATSVHRLLKRRHGVSWDPLLVALATYLAFATIRLWYQQWSIRNLPGATDLPVVTALIASLLLLVLALVAALPDESDLSESGIDLRSYYSKHQHYIWALLLVYELSWILLGLFFLTRAFTDAAALHRAWPWFYFGPPLALTGLATCWQLRRVQALALALLAGHDLAVNWGFYLR